jgi:niacin transporter
MNGLKAAYLGTVVDCNLSALRRIIFLAAFTALAIALPYVCHQFGIAGMVFLPMHFAVMIAAIVMGFRGGLAVALVSPVLSYALSAMPPLQSLLPITVELCAYAAAINISLRKIKLPLVVSLIVAMIFGRLVSLSFVGLILNSVSGSVQIKNLFLVGLPGIIIQLALVPPLASKITTYLGRK